MSSPSSSVSLVDGRLLRVFSESNRILRAIDHDDTVELVPDYPDCQLLLSSLLRLKSNRLYMIYGVKRSLTDCRYFGQFLDEEGRLDGTVVPIMLEEGYRLVDAHCLVQLKSGRLVLPTMLFDGSSGMLNPCSVVQLYYSDDEGESWDLSPQLIMGPLLSTLGLQSPAIIEIKDGHIRLEACSDNDERYYCHSFDDGLTWSRLIPIKETL